MASKQTGRQLTANFKAYTGKSEKQQASTQEKDDVFGNKGVKTSINRIRNLRAVTVHDYVPVAGKLRELSAKRAESEPRAITSGSSTEVKLRVAIAEVGLIRAREIIDAVAFRRR